jgi:raffinose/stachyose/melibiose transport system permease protein
VFVFPVFIVVINSFKLKFSIAQSPFLLPTSQTFTGFENYIEGIKNTGFPAALGWSLFITVFSVLAIIIFTSMTAWYITRVKSVFNSLLYYSLVFSMIVPFQMVMFTMSKTANTLGLDNPIGIIIIYLGFGAGLSVFMFSGFIKTVPLTIEEAATIDGAGILKIYYRICMPLVKPAALTLIIFSFQGLWNSTGGSYIYDEAWKLLPTVLNDVASAGIARVGSASAASVLMMIPPCVLFIFTQSRIVETMAFSGIKG